MVSQWVDDDYPVDVCFMYTLLVWIILLFFFVKHVG